MTRILKLALNYLHWVPTIELVLHDLDLLSWVPSELLQLNFMLTHHRPSRNPSRVIFILPLRILLLELRILNPVKEGLFDEDLTGVKYQTLLLAQGLHRVDHGLLVNAFEWMRCDDSFDLLCEAEWHEFRDAKVDTGAECYAKVDAKDLSVGGIDQEIF